MGRAVVVAIRHALPANGHWAGRGPSRSPARRALRLKHDFDRARQSQIALPGIELQTDGLARAARKIKIHGAIGAGNARILREGQIGRRDAQYLRGGRRFSIGGARKGLRVRRAFEIDFHVAGAGHALAAGGRRRIRGGRIRRDVFAGLGVQRVVAVALLAVGRDPNVLEQVAIAGLELRGVRGANRIDRAIAFHFRE